MSLRMIQHGTYKGNIVFLIFYECFWVQTRLTVYRLLEIWGLDLRKLKKHVEKMNHIARTSCWSFRLYMNAADKHKISEKTEETVISSRNKNYSRGSKHDGFSKFFSTF